MLYTFFLTPYEYGLIAIIVATMAILTQLTNLGYSVAMIQDRNLTEDKKNQLFSFFLLKALFNSVLLLIIGRFYIILGSNSILAKLFQLYAFGYFFNLLSIYFRTILRKELNFERISKVIIIANISGFFVLIISLNKRVGVYSLGLQFLTISLSSFLFYIVYSEHNFSKYMIIRPIYFGYKAFAGPIYIIGLLTTTMGNLEKFVIAQYLNPSVLGVYMLSYQLIVTSSSMIAFLVSSIMYPLISKLDIDSRRVKEIFLLSSKLIISTCILIIFSVLILRNSIITFMNGTSWNESRLIMLLLSPLAIIKVLSMPIKAIHYNNGKLFPLLKARIIAFIVLISILLILQLDLNLIIIAITAAELIYTIILLIDIFKLLSIDFSEYYSTSRYGLQMVILYSIVIFLDEIFYNIFQNPPFLIISEFFLVLVLGLILGKYWILPIFSEIKELEKNLAKEKSLI